MIISDNEKIINLLDEGFREIKKRDISDADTDANEKDKKKPYHLVTEFPDETIKVTRYKNQKDRDQHFNNIIKLHTGKNGTI